MPCMEAHTEAPSAALCHCSIQHLWLEMTRRSVYLSVQSSPFQLCGQEGRCTTLRHECQGTHMRLPVTHRSVRDKHNQVCAVLTIAHTNYVVPTASENYNEACRYKHARSSRCACAQQSTSLHEKMLLCVHRRTKQCLWVAWEGARLTASGTRQVTMAVHGGQICGPACKEAQQLRDHLRQGKTAFEQPINRPFALCDRNEAQQK